MTIFESLNKKYGVKIVSDSYYNSLLDRSVTLYNIISADGCSWEKGLTTKRAVKAECERWAANLTMIKEAVRAEKLAKRGV
jgi:hypothetical protein